MPRVLTCILIPITLLFWAGAAFAAEISPAFDFARSGNRILAACIYTIPPEYHSYSNDQGETGLPTTLEFTVEGEGAMPVLYPKGEREKDIYDKSKEVFTYNGEVVLVAVLPTSASGGMYAAQLNMLLCSDLRCMPDKQVVTGEIPANAPMLDDVPWKDKAEKLLASQGDSFGALSLEDGKAPPPIKAEPQTGQSSGVNTETPDFPPRELAGTLHAGDPDSFDIDLDPRYAESHLEIFTLGKALLLGILAGLLLNAMPCVLPVLTLKVSGLLMLGNLPDKQKLHHFRIHNICFAAGILTFFTFLAILLGSADLMWGQLYQNQTVLLIMLLIVFLMGLSMLGVFSLPVIDLRIGENTKNPMLQAYFTGLVSTFLATPCSGPLLGGALAWAFTQPMLALLAVFWSIGLGMALPYIAFCIWPNMARILPKPGKWMYVFEHILGFLLLGTAIYLLTIMPADKYTQILVVLLVVACLAWLWGKFCGPAAPPVRRKVMGATGMAILCAAIFWAMKPLPPAPQWQDFSPHEFMASLGKKNMLVEFTADWCPNCKFLEATVLSSRNLKSWSQRYGMELVKVDLTRPDPYAERLLAMLGSKSIPLTALFGKGEDALNPVALRDIYSKRNLEKYLAKTFGNS